MADTYIGTSTAGGISKKYIIRDGVAGNLSDSGKFYPLSSYELVHDVSGIIKNTAGQVTSYRIGATAAQVQQQVAKQAAAAIKNVDPQKTAGYSFRYTMSNSDARNYLAQKAKNASLTEYAYRLSKGITTESILGTYVSPVAGTHQVIKAPVGSGDKKLSALKSSSGVNNSASAKTNTAQTAKVTKTPVSSAIKQATQAVVKTPSKVTPSVVAQKTVVSLKDATSKRILDQMDAVKKTTKATPVITTKPTMLQVAGAQMQSALSGYASQISAPVTAQQKAAATKSIGISQPVSKSSKSSVISDIKKAASAVQNTIISTEQQAQKSLSNAINSYKAEQQAGLNGTSQAAIMQNAIYGKQTTNNGINTAKTALGGLLGSDKSGFGLVGLAGARVNTAQESSYTKHPGFDACKTGTCSLEWTQMQAQGLAQNDNGVYGSAKSTAGAVYHMDKAPSNSQLQQLKKLGMTYVVDGQHDNPAVWSKKKTTSSTSPVTNTQKTTPISPVIKTATNTTNTTNVTTPIIPVISKSGSNTTDQQAQWKAEMMAKYGLDSRGNKLGSNTGTAKITDIANSSFYQNVTNIAGSLRNGNYVDYNGTKLTNPNYVANPYGGSYRATGWGVKTKETLDKEYENQYVSNWLGSKTSSVLGVVGLGKYAESAGNAVSTTTLSAITKSQNKITGANTKAGQYTTLLPDANAVEATLKKYHAEKAIAATPFAGLAMIPVVDSAVEKTINKSSYVKSSSAGRATLSAIGIQRDIGQGVLEANKEEYEGLRTKPVSKALEYGSYYAGGELFGVLSEGSKAATASKFAKASEKTTAIAEKIASKVNNPLVKKAVSGIGKGAGYTLKDGKIIDIGMGGLLAADAITTVGSGYVTGGVKGATKSASEFSKSLAIGAKGYERGAEAIKSRSVFLLSPGTKKLTLQEIPVGASASVRDIEIGKTFAIADRPVISYTKKGGVSIGAPEIDTALIAGKTVHPYTRLDTRVLDTHIRKNYSPEEQKYWFGGREIASKSYKLTKSAENPTSFEIYSKQISEPMKPTVKQAIKEYATAKGTETQVYGSNALRMQIGQYLSGTPKDLEIHVDSVAKFSEVFRRNAKKNGFKEGKDFRITVEKKPVTTVVDGQAPKIEFMLDGAWEKGIEVFGKSDSTPMEAGYKPEVNLPFGFKQKPSVYIETIPTMSVGEQAVRNYRGGTTINDGRIVPDNFAETIGKDGKKITNYGRTKDVRRLIEIGVANENTFGLGTKQTLIDYTKVAAEKFPSMVKDSPLSEFIIKNDRLPTREEAFTINSNALDSSQKSVLSKAIERKSQNKLIKGTTNKLRTGEKITVGDSKVTSKKGLSDLLASEAAEASLSVKSKPTEIAEKAKPKARYTKAKEEEILKTKKPEVERDLLFDSRAKGTTESRSIGSMLETTSKGVGGSKALGVDISKVLGAGSNSIGQAKRDESKSKSKAQDITSKPVSVSPSKPVAKTSKSISIPKTTSKSIISPSSKSTSKSITSPSISKPITVPSKSIDIPSKSISKPSPSPSPSKSSPSPSKPSPSPSKPITTPSKPSPIPGTSKQTPSPSPTPSPITSKPSPIPSPSPSTKITPPPPSTKPTPGSTPNPPQYVPPTFNAPPPPEENIVGAGLPFVTGSRGGSIGLFGRTKLVSKTKVASFKETVGKKGKTHTNKAKTTKKAPVKKAARKTKKATSKPSPFRSSKKSNPSKMLG